MILLFIFWFLTLGFGILVFKKSGINENFILDKNLKNFKKKKKQEGGFLKKIGNIKYISDPGYLVKKTVNKKNIEAKINIVGKIISFKTFLGVKQFILSILGIYFWIYIWFGTVEWGTSIKIFIIFILAFYLPDLWLQIQKEKRMKSLEDEVPYFMDLLSLTLQTGMNIDQALLHTSKHKSGIVAEVVGKKLAELKFGRNIDDILDDIKKLLPNEEFNQFINAISRAKKLGVSLATTLEIQSNLIRTKRRQRAEEMSRTAAVKISLPLVLFIFPALLIIYIGPGLLNMMGT